MKTRSVMQTFVGGWSGMQFIRSSSSTTGHAAESGVVLVVPESEVVLVVPESGVVLLVPEAGASVVLGTGVPVVSGSGDIPKANINFYRHSITP